MLFKTDEKISKKLANEIEYLVEMQFQQEPFSEMNLSPVEVLRAKTCLIILDFAYLIFFINTFLKFDRERLRKLVDTSYNYFFENFKQKHYHTDILISEIVVNPKEQIEIMRISKEWGIPYEINVRTLLHNLFPMIYDYRIPLYLEAIGKSFQNVENNLMLPYFPVNTLFTDQFLKEHSSDFAVKFDLFINIETVTRIIKSVKDNL